MTKFQKLCNKHRYAKSEVAHHPEYIEAIVGISDNPFSALKAVYCHDTLMKILGNTMDALEIVHDISEHGYPVIHIEV
jgi:hypothetical protein